MNSGYGFYMTAIMILISLFGCAGSSESSAESPWADGSAELAYDSENGIEYMEGNCQHAAVYAAAVAISYGYEYEGILGMRVNPNTGKSEYHLQVRVLKDGQWLWANVRDNRRVELWENFGDWNRINKYDFEPDVNEPPLNLEEMIYYIACCWWDAFRS